MLENIKSYYFLRISFSYINDRIKLELVKYNKKMQSILDINLYIYQLFAGKYLVLDKKGKGEEYKINNNKLIFKGEYKNGKKHGKGEEFDTNGKLIFSGNYLNGKKNGKGKLIDKYNDRFFFEGEFKDNKKWTGIGYFIDDKYYPISKISKQNNDNRVPIYEIKDGKGSYKEYYDQLLSLNISFEGVYINGELNGKCKKYSFEGDLLFEGEYLNGKMWNIKGYDENGNITYELKNGKGHVKQNISDIIFYEADYLNGEKNGIYKHYYLKKLIFELEYKNDKKHGKGKEYYNGKLEFEGEYLYDMKIKGKQYINGRLEYEGEYLYGEKWNGKGYDEYGNIIYILNNGNGKVKKYLHDFLIYDGELLNGKKNGLVKEYDGIKLFVGEYLKGEKNGKGKEYSDENEKSLIFEWEYLNGKRNGKGKEYNKNGELIYEGEYLNGLRNGKGI